MTARLGVRRTTAVRAAAVTAVAFLGLRVWLGWSMTKAGDDPATVGGWHRCLSSSVFRSRSRLRQRRGTSRWPRTGRMAPRGSSRSRPPGRHGGRDEWGGPSLIAAGGFAGFAAITLVASRTMLANDRTGILAGILVSVPILLATGLIAACAGRSFRTGLECGLVALLASLAGILVVALPEAVTWYRTAGIWILDGDSPPHGIAGPDEAVRDALTGVPFFYLMFWHPLAGDRRSTRRLAPRPALTTSAASQPRSSRRLPGIWSRYRGVKTQNSLPSGSAITTQLTSPWPMSIRVAPRETRRSTSAC